MTRPPSMKGREIKDATRRVTINITQEHIDDAVALNGELCIAGRCTIQALSAKVVWYYRTKALVGWDVEGPILRYQNSESLTKNVIEILDDPDRPNSEIKPGLYDLLPPPPGQRLGLDRTRKGPKRSPHPAHRHHRVLGRVSAARVIA